MRIENPVTKQKMYPRVIEHKKGALYPHFTSFKMLFEFVEQLVIAKPNVYCCCGKPLKTAYCNIPGTTEHESVNMECSVCKASVPYSLWKAYYHYVNPRKRKGFKLKPQQRTMAGRISRRK